MKRLLKYTPIIVFIFVAAILIFSPSYGDMTKPFKGDGVTLHNLLSNLGFDVSGHTGYARDVGSSSLDFNVASLTATNNINASGTVNAEQGITIGGSNINDLYISTASAGAQPSTHIRVGSQTYGCSGVGTFTDLDVASDTLDEFDGSTGIFTVKNEGFYYLSFYFNGVKPDPEQDKHILLGMVWGFHGLRHTKMIRHLEQGLMPVGLYIFMQAMK